MDNNTVYEWILKEFTVSARAQSVHRIKPYLITLVRSGDEILDLCCGSGPASFWFEELGAKVTGVDIASYMIALAREEASLRNSSVEFIEADMFKYDLGQGCFDMVSCFGNSISNFPPSDFANLGRKVAAALKPMGRFIVQYHDGSYEYIKGGFTREGIYQEKPERITYRFEGYLPEIGAYVKRIRNETRGVEYQRKGFIYTVPVVQLAMSDRLKLDRHIVIAENHFMDIFVKEEEHSM
jgi:ubiquinone/menaquinone biosynthesis C-methylase UbiE